MTDSRFGIWNELHDGVITIMHRESPDVLVMFVSIPYVRRRIEPLGDSFSLRLGGFRGMRFLDVNGVETDRELDYVEGFEILDCMLETMPAYIQLTIGTLILDFDSLDISLDSGQSVTYEEVRSVAQDYWDEWNARTK